MYVIVLLKGSDSCGIRMIYTNNGSYVMLQAALAEK